MKPRYKLTTRKGVLGVFDSLEKIWHEIPKHRDGELWCGYGYGNDAEGFVRYKNAKDFRAQFEIVWGNDFAIKKAEKSPNLSVIVGGAA